MVTKSHHSESSSTVFLNVVLFILVGLLTAIVFFEFGGFNNLTAVSVAINIGTAHLLNSYAMMASIGFASGIVGGGSAILLTGRYLIRS